MLKYTRKDKRLKIPVGINPSYNVDASLMFNTSDADAKPEDLVLGKTAYSIEGYITGTLDLESEKTNSYNDGYANGNEAGYNNGYNAGNEAGYNNGYTQGEQDGYISGEADGYADGYAEGKDDGIEEILTEQSDANITPGSVLEGYIGYGANNERIVGTNVGGFDFSEIGYSENESAECNRLIKDNITYTKSLMPVVPSTSLNGKFRSDTNLVYAPYIDTSITTDMQYMFYECSNLKYIPQYDYSNVKTLYQAFAYSGIKELDFSFSNNIETFRQVASYSKSIEKLVINAESVNTGYGLYGVAYETTNLKHLEIFNIPSSVTDSEFWRNLTKIEYIKLTGNTSGIKPLTSSSIFSFNGYSNLHTVILDIDTHFLTSCAFMFNNCKSLMNIPYFNTSNVTEMNSMFYNCSSIISVPEFDTSNVTTFYQMFRSSSVEDIPLLDAGNVNNCGLMFRSCTTVKNLGGFKDLGKSFTGSNGTNHNIDLGSNDLLTYQSCINVFNNLYDMNLTSVTDAKISLSLTTKALLSDEDKAIATNKGWTIA